MRRFAAAVRTVLATVAIGTFRLRQTGCERVLACAGYALSAGNAGGEATVDDHGLSCGVGAIGAKNTIHLATSIGVAQRFIGTGAFFTCSDAQT